MYKYLLCILLGIILFILLNNINSFNVGGLSPGDTCIDDDCYHEPDGTPGECDITTNPCWCNADDECELEFSGGDAGGGGVMVPPPGIGGAGGGGVMVPPPEVGDGDELSDEEIALILGVDKLPDFIEDDEREEILGIKIVSPLECSTGDTSTINLRDNQDLTEVQKSIVLDVIRRELTTTDCIEFMKTYSLLTQMSRRDPSPEYYNEQLVSCSYVTGIVEHSEQDVIVGKPMSITDLRTSKLNTSLLDRGPFNEMELNIVSVARVPNIVYDSSYRFLFDKPVFTKVPFYTAEELSMLHIPVPPGMNRERKEVADLSITFREGIFTFPYAIHIPGHIEYLRGNWMKYTSQTGDVVYYNDQLPRESGLKEGDPPPQDAVLPPTDDNPGYHNTMKNFVVEYNCRIVTNASKVAELVTSGIQEHRLREFLQPDQILQIELESGNFVDIFITARRGMSRTLQEQRPLSQSYATAITYGRKTYSAYDLYVKDTSILSVNVILPNSNIPLCIGELVGVNREYFKRGRLSALHRDDGNVTMQIYIDQMFLRYVLGIDDWVESPSRTQFGLQIGSIDYSGMFSNVHPSDIEMFDQLQLWMLMINYEFGRSPEELEYHDLLKMWVSFYRGHY